MSGLTGAFVEIDLFWLYKEEILLIGMQSSSLSALCFLRKFSIRVEIALGLGGMLCANEVGSTNLRMQCKYLEKSIKKIQITISYSIIS